VRGRWAASGQSLARAFLLDFDICCSRCRDGRVVVGREAAAAASASLPSSSHNSLNLLVAPGHLPVFLSSCALPVVPFPHAPPTLPESTSNAGANAKLPFTAWTTRRASSNLLLRCTLLLIDLRPHAPSERVLCLRLPAMAQADSLPPPSPLAQTRTLFTLPSILSCAHARSP
jgi:hypothetical protein